MLAFVSTAVGEVATLCAVKSLPWEYVIYLLFVSCGFLRVFCDVRCEVAGDVVRPALRLLGGEKNYHVTYYVANLTLPARSHHLRLVGGGQGCCDNLAGRLLGFIEVGGEGEEG